jgi:hypothetical protein
MLTVGKMATIEIEYVEEIRLILSTIRLGKEILWSSVGRKDIIYA